MLRTRLVTAAVALPVVAWLIFAAPLWVFAGILVAITAVGLGEFVAMAFPEQPYAQALAIAAGLALAAVVVLQRFELVGPVLVFSLVVGLLVALRSKDLEK
ncbi:MAG: hypothetical protein ABGY42_00320, partial [bacterium]